jgi:hypothetical protein
LKKRWPIAVLGTAILVSTLLILYLGRGQTLVVDQWGYLYGFHSWSPQTLLTPHNGHLIVLPLLVYKTLFAVFGIESHLPFQLVTLALSATVASLLFVLIRDRVGDLLALGAATLVLFYGAGAEVILPTFMIPNLLGLSSGLGMLLVLRREDLRGDLAACLLLAMSLASFSIGVAFAAGAIVMLALRPPGQRLSRAWVVALPLLAYVAWALWARKFDQQSIYVHNLKILGSAVFDQLGAALAGLTGLFTTPNGPPADANPVPIRTEWAPALIVGLAVIVIVRLRRLPPPTASALAAVTVLLGYFLLVGIALNMFRNTFDPRLVYLGSVLTLLALAELVAPYRPGRAALAVAGVVLVFSLCANIAELGDSAKMLRAESAANRAKLAAIEIAGGSVPAGFLVEEPPEDMTFNVAAWRELEADYGSPAYSPADLVEASPAAREAADEELFDALGIRAKPLSVLRPFSTGEGVRLAIISSGEVRRRRACAAIDPLPGAEMVAVFEALPGGFSYVSGAAPLEVTLGRFADATHAALNLPSGASQVRIPEDGSARPWVVSVTTGTPALICPVAR